jgi:hypothetical protein
MASQINDSDMEGSAPPNYNVAAAPYS